MLAVSLGGLLFTLFVFVYYKRIVFLFCFSSSCVPYVGSFSGKALIYVICVCLLYTYYVFIKFFFVLCTLCWQFLWEGSYLRYLCLFTIHIMFFVLFFFVLCTLCWQFLWEGSYLRYLCLFTIHILCFCFVFLRLVYPMLAVSLGGLLFTLFVFVYYTHIVFLFCFSSSCVPYVGRFSGRTLIYVICVCLLYTYCVFVLFFFVLCTLCWQFLWEGSYLRYLCLFTINVLCFCFVFLRLVYPMLAVSLGRLLFTLFVFVYYTRIVFLFFCLRLVYPMLAVSLGRLLFTLFVFVYYTRIVFLFCFSSSCVPYVGSFSGRALIYVICVCLLYTYCVFVLFFFVLCTLCWQFPWEGSYLRYLCLFTIHVLCFCFVFLRLVYPMLAVSLGGLLFTLFVFVYYTRIVFLFCFSSSCVPYVGSFSGKALIYLCLLFVFGYYTHIVFLFCCSSSCVPYVGSFSGKALIYVICVCLLYTYCVFVLFFFVLCTLCWQFLWEGSYLRYLCLFTIHILCFYFVFLRLVYPMLAVSLGGLLFTLFVFVYYTRIVFLFCFSSSCVPYVGSFSGRALIYVICVCLLYTFMFLLSFSSSCVRYLCVCLLYTYCVFVLFFFVLCTLCWKFLWEGSYLRYLCLFTIHILCFCFVFLRLVYPMLAVSLGGLLFTLFVFVYYKRIVFLFCFSSSCVPYVGSFSGRALIYVICVCLL